MSFMKRSPCQKYYEKSTKEELQKSLSATRFVPFRRASDTTSDSGSDDFKLEAAEDVSSSFSRSSSESCQSFGVNARYQCILKDLNEITNLDKKTIESKSSEQNESLDDFRSRLNLRRKIKTRDMFTYQDDDRTDNSCDSTTTKAHEEILRNANLLKQEQVDRTDSEQYSGKKLFHKDLQYRYNRTDQLELNKNRHQSEETMLLNEFDKILQIQNEDEESKASDFDTESLQYQASSSGSKTIARSSTENFILKSNSTKSKSTASPRFRRKTHSQVLKAASSIPSLIFSNKSLKLQKSSNNFNYLQNEEKFVNSPKKGSIDDDMYNVSKARRSPLRFLGNFVDDKIFRGRWSSTKRAKSTDEITWALANEDLIQNELGLLKESNRTRKKSLGMLSTNSTSSNNTEEVRDKKPFKPLPDKNKNMSDLVVKKLFQDNYNDKKDSENGSKSKMADLKKRKTSNTLSIVDLSPVSMGAENKCHPSSKTVHLQPPSTQNNEISAETLAEIEAFEELLKNHLQS